MKNHVFSFVVFGLGWIQATAAPGDLDTTFGTGGKVTTSFTGDHDIAHGVAVQPDGKIVVGGQAAGDFALARYNSDGSLDSSFGGGGKVTTPIGSGSASGSSVALQSDGKIVVAGFCYNGSDYDIALVRYTDTGALDLSFGSGGIVTTPIGSGNDSASSVALQSDGKIVVAGRSFNGSNDDFALVRYTDTGALDTSFGTGGKVTTPIGSGNDFGESVRVQSDGKLVVAGDSYNGYPDIALVRYTSTGALDTSFGSGGKVTTSIGSFYDFGRSVAVQSDGKIIVGGSSGPSGGEDIALVRYTSSGTLDASFGTGGRVTTPVGSDIDYALAVALQSDGKIIAAGSSGNGSNLDLALVRYNGDGTLDTSFGTGGKVTTPVGSGDDVGYSVALQGDGKIIVAGSSINGSYNDFAMVRYEGNDLLTQSPTLTAPASSAVTASPVAVTFALPEPALAGSVTLSFGSTVLTLAASQQSAGAHSFTFNPANPTASLQIAGGSAIADGVYTVTLSYQDALGNPAATASSTNVRIDTTPPTLSLPGNITTEATGPSGAVVTYAAGAGDPGGSGVATSSFTPASGSTFPPGITTVNVSATDNAGNTAIGSFTVTVTSAAQWGLDPAFGSAGKVTLPIGSGDDDGQSVAVQSDGKIVVAGYSYTGLNADFALLRFTDAGVLDTSFGTGGIVTTAIGGGDYGYSVALQSDGKIVVAGYSYIGGTYDFALVRYTDTGALDTGFGTGGTVTTPIGSDYDYGHSVAVQSDGKIVVAGISFNGSNYDFALVRYNADGTLDSDFGSGGKVTTPIGTGANSHDHGQSVVVQSDGKIVVAGYSFNGTNDDFALVRYNTEGGLDTGFGSGGKVTTPIGTGNDLGYSVAVQSNGKIIVAGYSFNGSNDDFALVRYTDTGALDTSFGTGGMVTTPIGTGNDLGYSVALQSNGKIVVAGDSYNGSNFDFALVRYNTDGTLDTGFGSGGKLTAPIDSGGDNVSVAVQSNGNIVVAGSSYNGSNTDFAVVRYEGVPLDATTDAPTLTAPASSAVTASAVAVSFTLPEPALAGSVTLSFGGTVLTLAASQQSAGAHGFTFNPANPTASPQIAGGSAIADGVYTVTLSYQDVYGNPAATASSTNVRIDTTPPTLSLPGNITTEATGSSGAVVTYAAGASDPGGSGVATSSFTPASGSTFALGMTTVNASATDNAGNTAIGSFTVTVQDTTGPVVTVPGNITVEATSPIGAAVSFSVSATDLVDGAVTATPNYASGSTFPIGTTTVNVAALDSRGNPGGASFTVTVTNSAQWALDVGFGSGGKVSTPTLSDSESGYSVAVQSDGKIVVAGSLWNASTGLTDDFALARYTSTGALDATFGSGGKVNTPIGSGNEVGRSVAVQSDGKIVVAGYSYNGSTDDFALVRYTDTGALDTSFGTGGMVTTPIGSSSDTGYSVALQSDGKIVVAGQSSNGSNSDFALVRYTSTGALDTTFGSGGKVTTPIGSSSDFGQGVAVQSDGRIVVAGISSNGSNNDFALVRYTSTGALDTTFGTGGKVTTPIGSSNDRGFSVALQSDGKIVVAGDSYNGSNFDFALVRYDNALAPAVQTLAATSITSTSATLRGNIHPDGSSSTVSFDYGTGAGYGTNVAGTPSPITGNITRAVSADITGLMPNTTYHFRVNCVNAVGMTNGSDLTFTTLTSSESWRLAYFGTTQNSGNAADTADPDGDGIPNLIEFGCNLNPNGSSQPPGVATVNEAVTVIEFTYTRSVAALADGVTFAVEWSDTLNGASWNNAGVTESILSDNGTVQQVKAFVPAGSGGRRFVRLKVTRL